MCGIVGFSGHFDPTLLERMSASMAHRGPDDRGIFCQPENRIGLAHRRLAIIDLSHRSCQPMWDSTRRVVGVYNGELYNYRSLRTQLRARGFGFHSESDTEVLLNLYLENGTGMLDSMNGIYAFAIWDTRNETLFLARDCLGVKPLYYAETSRGCLFASELKSLLHDSELDRSLDFTALHNHLRFLWCPSPRTILSSVKKLPAGHAMLVHEGRIERCWRHYQLPHFDPNVRIDVGDAISRVRDELERAVHRQMVSDVEVGAFLSGGLDSSTVVALAQKSVKRPMKCFTMVFDDDSDDSEGMSEDARYAEIVARHLGSQLIRVHADPSMIGHLSTMLFHLDEPQGDPAPINALLIAEAARKAGIKVLLSGAGGDDIFSGYRRHLALTYESTWAWIPRPGRRAIEALANQMPATSAKLRWLNRAFRFASRNADERIARYFEWMRPEGLMRLYSPEIRELLVRAGTDEPLVDALRTLPPEVHRLDRMLYLDARFFLADHNLNYTDKVAMAHGVEVRVPLLDIELIDLVARLPPCFKQRGRTGKWILKQAIAPLLPTQVLTRRKRGFGAPLRRWLQNELRDAVDAVLSEESIKRRGLFSPRDVRELIERDRAQRVDAAYTIFAMLCLEIWQQIFVDGNTPKKPCYNDIPTRPRSSANAKLLPAKQGQPDRL